MLWNIFLRKIAVIRTAILIRGFMYLFEQLVDYNENHCESYVQELRMSTNYLQAKITRRPHMG
jgi:hypothetical protein